MHTYIPARIMNIIAPINVEKDKQRLFDLYKNADNIVGKTKQEIAGFKMTLAKQYLANHKGILKVDILIQEKQIEKEARKKKLFEEKKAKEYVKKNNLPNNFVSNFFDCSKLNGCEPKIKNETDYIEIHTHETTNGTIWSKEKWENVDLTSLKQILTSIPNQFVDKTGFVSRYDFNQNITYLNFSKKVL